MAARAGNLIFSLIGLPGSGKSTVGRQLARRLQLPFFDSDQVIEERLGCPIRQYFEREGEESFRDIESAVIDDLTLEQVGQVLGIATPTATTHLQRAKRKLAVWLNEEMEND